MWFMTHKNNVASVVCVILWFVGGHDEFSPPSAYYPPTPSPRFSARIKHGTLVFNKHVYRSFDLLMYSVFLLYLLCAHARAREKRVVRGVSATGHAKTPGERKNKNRVKKEQTTLFHLFVYYVFFSSAFPDLISWIDVCCCFFFPPFLNDFTWRH